MSFTSSIAGCPPNSSFIFTTTSVSATNGSFENLSATNASIVNLTTTTFSPVNVNSSLVDTTELIAVSASISQLSASSVSVDYITAGNIQAQDANISSIQSEFSTISQRLFIQDKSVAGQTSYIERDANILKFCGSLLGPDIDPTIEFYTNQGVGFPKLKILANSDLVETNNLNVIDAVECNQLLCNTTLETSQLNCNFVSSANIANLGLITTDRLEAQTIKADLSENLAAGQGISLSTVAGITTINNIGSVTDPLNIGTINVSNLSAHQIHVSNMSLDGTLGGNTANLLVANIQSVNSSVITADVITGNIGGNLQSGNNIFLNTVNDVTTVSTTANLTTNILQANILRIEDSTLPDNTTIARSSNVIDIIGTTNNVSVDFNFFLSNPTARQPILTLDGTSSAAVVHGNLNVSGLIVGDVSSNLLAGTGISLTTIAGVTTIQNTAQTSDPLNLSVLNASTINSSNINNSSTITTLDLNATNIGSVLVASTDVIATTATAATINTSVGNISTVNSNHINNINTLTTAGLVSDTIHCSSLHSSQTIFANNISFTNGIVGQVGTYLICQDIASVSIAADDINISSVANISTLNVQTQMTATNASFLNISASNAITSTSLTADISSNLTAGSGIALSTASGITTIEATGGLSTSTQYAFQVTSNLNNNQSIVPGSVAIFDAIEICVPSTSAYNTSGYYYTCPVAGLYKFGLKAFINSDVDNFRLAIWKNGGFLMAMGGAGSEASEAFETINQMAAGDTVYVGCVSGQAYVYMASKHSWWYGHLLQPENNTVGITTDLSVGTLNALTSITAPTITGEISGNLSQGNNIVLTTALGVTEIGTIPDLTANSITTATANIINLSTPLLGVGSFFTRRQNGVYSPGSSSQQYYSNFDTAVVSNPHVSWVTPNIGTGGANTGFIINTSGTYKIDWTFIAHSVAYNNRIGWFTRLYKNGATWDADRYVGFIYTRGDQTSFAQWGSSSSHCIVNLVAGDYIHLVTNIAKSSPLHNNLWDQIEAGWGAVCSFQILAFA